MPYRPDSHEVEVIWPDDLFVHLEDHGWRVANIVRAIRVTVVLRDRIGFCYERLVTPKDYLSQNDVGRILGVPLMTVIRWCKSSKLARKKKNGYWIVKLEDVLAFAAKMGRKRIAKGVIFHSRQRRGGTENRNRAGTTRRASKRAVQSGGKE
jgi:hypothetical protein